MPSWGVHLAVVKEILNKIEIENKNDFIFGNLLPDVQNGYAVMEVSKKLSHKISHFDDFPKGVFGCHKKFLETYGNSVFKDTMKLAYYTHLFTDDIWNREFYQNKVIFNNGEIEGVKSNNGNIIKGVHEDIRKLKHTDFGEFSKYVVSCKRDILPEYDKTLVDKSNNIDIVDITEKDLEKVFKYLELNIKSNENKGFNPNFKILSLEEAEKIFNMCVEEISSSILNENCH